MSKSLSFVVAIVGTLSLVTGCAGKQSTSDPRPAESRQVQGEPPDEEPPDELPAGAPVAIGGTEDGSERSARRHRQGGVTPEARRRQADEAYVTEREVESLLRRGPSSIFRAVTVEPVERDGSFRGYRIVDATQTARRVMRPQLRIGDIIQTVNDVPIERPGDYMEAWEKLEERAVFEIEYRRDGERQEAHWVVDERSRE